MSVLDMHGTRGAQLLCMSHMSSTTAFPHWHTWSSITLTPLVLHH